MELVKALCLEIHADNTADLTLKSVTEPEVSALIKTSKSVAELMGPGSVQIGILIDCGDTLHLITDEELVGVGEAMLRHLYCERMIKSYKGAVSSGYTKRIKPRPHYDA